MASEAQHTPTEFEIACEKAARDLGWQVTSDFCRPNGAVNRYVEGNPVYAQSWLHALAIEAVGEEEAGELEDYEVVDRVSRFLAELPTTLEAAKSECAALKQGTAGGNHPADCDWPVCGCDPYANKVIAALEEAGALPSDAAKPDTSEPNLPALRLDGIDEYGPRLGWFQPWTSFPIGTEFSPIAKARRVSA